ncbi:MAG: rod shape-determining protein MreC [Bacteroidales bacterium]
MRNLISYILKNYFFFLFLLLQVVSFIFIVQNHQHHRSFFFNSSNYVVGSIYQINKNIVKYFSLAKTNRQLSKENNELLSQIQGSFLKTDQQVFTYRDTLYQRNFSYINARVINNSVTSRNNYITLNKGRKHGVKPDMGIITSHGVIGIVRNVSQNFSTAISLLHSDSQISARIQKNNHLGTLIWEGFDYKKATMLYIPTHIDLNVGDTIVTSGFSQIFPADVFLGTIADFEIRRGDNFYTLEVDLATDFNQLDYVNVVNNIFKEELETLENATITTE